MAWQGGRTGGQVLRGECSCRFIDETSRVCAIDWESSDDSPQAWRVLAVMS